MRAGALGPADLLAVGYDTGSRPARALYPLSASSTRSSPGELPRRRSASRPCSTTRPIPRRARAGITSAASRSRPTARASWGLGCGRTLPAGPPCRALRSRDRARAAPRRWRLRQSRSPGGRFGRRAERGRQRGDRDRAALARPGPSPRRRSRTSTSSAASKKRMWSSRAANMRFRRSASSSNATVGAVHRDRLVGADAQHERRLGSCCELLVRDLLLLLLRACAPRSACVRSGVITMKMMSSTSTTSTSGVTFICGGDAALRRSPLADGSSPWLSPPLPSGRRPARRRRRAVGSMPLADHERMPGKPTCCARAKSSRTWPYVSFGVGAQDEAAQRLGGVLGGAAARSRRRGRTARSSMWYSPACATRDLHRIDAGLDLGIGVEDARQVDLHVLVHARRDHHEDDQQHEDDVDERRDVDVGRDAVGWTRRRHATRVHARTPSSPRSTLACASRSAQSSIVSSSSPAERVERDSRRA